MRGILSAVLASAVAAAIATPATAQYPDRPVKMIVPWAAGGDTDAIFRPFAPLMQKHLGQPVVDANVGGASGTSRRARGERLAPDGYTVYAVHDYIHLVHYAGITDVKYTDFEPICLLSATPSVLTASPKTPWKDLCRSWRTRRSGPGKSRSEPRSDRPATSSPPRSRSRPASSSNMCLTRAWLRA